MSTEVFTNKQYQNYRKLPRNSVSFFSVGRGEIKLDAATVMSDLTSNIRVTSSTTKSETEW